jgi:hypothetical protein
MKYTLFIDESGDFKGQKGQWLISGFLCNAGYEESTRALDKVLSKLPEKLGIKSVSDFHLTEFRENFGHDVAIEKAGVLFDTLKQLPFDYHCLTTVNESKIKLINPEKTYRIMIFDLLSLLESVLPEEQRIEQLDIVVATRTINGVRMTNVSDIEDDVIRQLPQALEVDLATKGLVDIMGSKIKIQLGSAYKLWGLIVADFLANTTYNNKFDRSLNLLENLKEQGLYTGFKTFSQYKERRAFVAERDADYALACVRWLLIIENESSEVANRGLNRTFISLFTKLGPAGARTTFEAILDRVWRLCKPNAQYDRFITLLNRLKACLSEVVNKEVISIDVFVYRTNVFLLKVINHIGNTTLAFTLLDEQKKLVSHLVNNPDNLSLIMDGLLVESEVYFNDLDFEEAYAKAQQSYEVAENYSSLSAILLNNEEDCNSSHSVIFLKAKMNYLRHAIRHQENRDDLSKLLKELDGLNSFLQEGDLSRFRIMRSQILVKLGRYNDAILETSFLFDGDQGAYNKFDQLTYLKALNSLLTSGNSLTEKMIYQVEMFTNEDTSKTFHPVELIFREFAIFYYLNNNLKLAKKFILKSGKAITANNSKISDYLYTENQFLEDLFKNKIKNDKNYFSEFSFEINNRLDKKTLIKKLASISPL